MIHVVDTHALLWHIEGSKRLSEPARRVLSDTADALVIPTIVLAEARYAIARQRTTVSWQDLLEEIERDSRFNVHDLNIDIVRRAPDELEMHDALICATALILHEASGERVGVITKDSRIRDSALVNTVW